VIIYRHIIRLSCLTVCSAITCGTSDPCLPLYIYNAHHGLTKKASVHSGSTKLPPPYNWGLRSSGLLEPWKSERWAFPKCRQPATNLRCITSQKNKGLNMLLINASHLPLWDALLQLARDTTVSKWQDGISN